MVMHEVLSVAGDALQATIFAASKALATLQEDCTSKSGGLRGGSFAFDSSNAEDDTISSTMTQPVLLPRLPLGVDDDYDDESSLVSRTIRWLSSGDTLADRVVESYPSGGAAEEQMYHTMWTAWSAIFAICGMVSFLIWLAILLSKKASKSPFNYYLLYLLFPDWSSTLNCAITCALNAAAGHYVSQGMCLWQSWYIIWGVSTNAWLNAVVMFEIHSMLKSSRIRKRYFPPTKRRVNWNALYVNLWTAFVASWGLYSFPWLPHQTSVLGGLTCNPVQHDPKSTLFLWLCFMPCFFLVPYFYAVYVAVDVWRKNLLPPKGRRRFIAIYFFRIVAVLVVMWGPVIICFFVLAHTSPWVVWFGGVWGHLQTLLSAVVSALKPDVATALWQLLTCKYKDLRDDTGGTSDVFNRSGDFSVSSSGPFARRRSSSTPGSRPERRTNAITDANFRKAVEQFTRENPKIIHEHEDPVGDNDSEDEEADHEKILQAAMAFGGGNSSSNVKPLKGSRSENVTRAENSNDAESNNKRPSHTTRTPSVVFAEPLEVEQNSSPDAAPRRSFNNNPIRTSLRSNKERHVHYEIEDRPDATTEPQSSIDNDSEENDLPAEAEKNEDMVIDTENEITAGVVGATEADESTLPVPPFANAPQPAKRRLSNAQMRIIQEHLNASSSRNLDLSSSDDGSGHNTAEGEHKCVDDGEESKNNDDCIPLDTNTADKEAA